MYQSLDQWAESIASSQELARILFSHHPLLGKILPGILFRTVQLRDLRRSVEYMWGVMEFPK